MTAVPPSPSALVGRSDELGRLTSAVGLGPTADGTGAVLLAGDAGVGKTRLLIELREAALVAGWRVVVGHCIDFGDGGLPYLPFSDAFGQLAAESPALLDTLVEAGPAIARLLPARRGLAGAPATERTDRVDLFESVHAALTRLSQDAPVLLIVEDVHWADQSSRDLLSFLFSRGFAAPVAVVVSYRTDDLHRRHPLRPTLAEWGRLPSVTRLALGPLAERDVRRLVLELHAEPMPEAAVSGLVARADGNAFFVEELVSAAQMGDTTLPADLADLLLVRLERLDEDARLVVRAASASGRRVSHAMLDSVAGVDAVTLDQALRAAVEGNVLVPVGSGSSAGYAFRHALLAEAVYDDLLPGERVRLHAAYATAMEAGALGGTAAELARHARAAHDVPTAIRASVRAGDEAMAVGGPDEAARHYEVALELLAEPSAGPSADLAGVDRIELTVRAGEAAAIAGHLFRGLALVQDGLARLPTGAPPEQRARLLLAVSRMGLLGDTGVDALALTTEALTLVPEDPPTRLRAQVALVHSGALEDRSRDDQAGSWAAEAQRLARDLDLPEVAVEAATALARLERRAGDPEASQRSLEASIAQARATGEVAAEMRGLFTLAGLHYERARLAEARATYESAAELSRRTGRPWAPYGVDARAMGAIVAQVQGDWDEARRMVDVRGEAPPAMAEAALAAVDLAVLAGRGSDRVLTLQPHLRAWWDRDGLIALLTGSAMMETQTARGEVDAALKTHDDIVTTVSALWQRKSFAAQTRLGALALAALSSEAGRSSARERSELVDRGRALLERATSAAETSHDRGPGPEGRAWLARLQAEWLRLRWTAGVDAPAGDELVSAWRAALEGFERFGHVHEIARTQARLAAALRAVGNSAEAAELVASARETATRLGAQPLLSELRLLGTTRTPTHGAEERPTPESLTPREAEVLALVAEGRSNREVAARLFISAKTVSVHVSNILAKLGAGGRTEAVAIARRRGLLEDEAATHGA